MSEALYDFPADAVEGVADTALLFSRLGVPLREQRCPFCEAVIYSKRHKRCGVCASLLPDRCLFTPEQAESVELLLQEERQRHRAWLHRNLDC
jgi:hypothetical protein